MPDWGRRASHSGGCRTTHVIVRRPRTGAAPSGHNPPVFPRAIVQRMSLRTSVATLVWPPPGIPSGHNPPGFSGNYRTTHVIANQRRNAGVAIRSLSLPLRGRWHGAAVTDEGKPANFLRTFVSRTSLRTSDRRHWCGNLPDRSKTPDFQT